MEDVFIYCISLLFIGILIISGIFVATSENQDYIYECTDYKGDLIYCKRANWTKGGMFGTTEDGRTILITSYKRILKEERNK